MFRFAGRGRDRDSRQSARRDRGRQREFQILHWRAGGERGNGHVSRSLWHARDQRLGSRQCQRGADHEFRHGRHLWPDVDRPCGPEPRRPGDRHDELLLWPDVSWHQRHRRGWRRKRCHDHEQRRRVGGDGRRERAWHRRAQLGKRRHCRQRAGRRGRRERSRRRHRPRGGQQFHERRHGQRGRHRPAHQQRQRAGGRRARHGHQFGRHPRAVDRRRRRRQREREGGVIRGRTRVARAATAAR